MFTRSYRDNGWVERLKGMEEERQIGGEKIGEGLKEASRLTC